MNMASGQRKPADGMHHNDQWPQATSVAFGLRCNEAGVRPSQGSFVDAHDNAMCESFFATRDNEPPGRRKFQTEVEARTAIVASSRARPAPGRSHSALGCFLPTPTKQGPRDAGVLQPVAFIKPRDIQLHLRSSDIPTERSL